MKRKIGRRACLVNHPVCTDCRMFEYNIISSLGDPRRSRLNVIVSFTRFVSEDRYYFVYIILFRRLRKLKNKRAYIKVCYGVAEDVNETMLRMCLRCVSKLYKKRNSAVD